MDCITPPDVGQLSLTTLADKINAEQPGRLSEQLAAIDLFLGDPSRRYDRDAAWQAARKLCIAHVRRAA